MDVVFVQPFVEWFPSKNEGITGESNAWVELPCRIHLATGLQHTPVQLCQGPVGIQQQLGDVGRRGQILQSKPW